MPFFPLVIGVVLGFVSALLFWAWGFQVYAMRAPSPFFRAFAKRTGKWLFISPDVVLDVTPPAELPADMKHAYVVGQIDAGEHIFTLDLRATPADIASRIAHRFDAEELRLVGSGLRAIASELAREAHERDTQTLARRAVS